jgi:hypothetical protein
MGAFITYLNLVYGIQHYLIVAPGNTIYRKLVDDFKLPNNPKYVFKGIAEINANTARIITKDNYEQNPDFVPLHSPARFIKKSSKTEKLCIKFQICYKVVPRILGCSVVLNQFCL